MTTSYESLTGFSEHQLLEHFDRLVVCDRKNTAQLLMAIAEIDERKLWAKHACSSMFVFCMRHYHMSEQVTAKRIWAARTARRFPVVLRMLACGELHLSAIHLLSKHLTTVNHRELLRRARHKSSREIEVLVAEIAPRPDVPSRIRALPRRRLVIGGTGSGMASEPTARGVGAALDSVSAGTAGECEAAGAESASASEVQPGFRVEPAAATPLLPVLSTHKQITPLAPRRFKIEITVDQETHDKLRSLQDLLSHQDRGRDPAAIIGRAIELLLAQTLKRKAALTNRPRPPAFGAGSAQADVSHGSSDTGEGERRSRTIPAAMRRKVWLRDFGRCAFVDGRGRRCGASRGVEFHHKVPFGKGGLHPVENLELRCRAHNQYQADLDFGAQFMRAKREQENEHSARNVEGR